MEKKKRSSGASSSSSSSYLCIAPIFSACVPKQSNDAAAGRNNRLSFSFFPGGGGGNGKQQPEQPPEPEDPNSESIIDPAASVIARKDKDKDSKDGRQQHCGVIVGTIFGRRTGHVTFCVQRDAAAPPPFLFELAVPMQSLAAEIGSGLLRIALECHRGGGGPGGNGAADRNVWRATCNGRDVGHAVRRRPTDCDRRVLESMRAMTSGVGVLPPAPAVEGEGEDGDGGGCGEVLYMRATYERVVGSRDAVSYHLISPGGTAGGSPPQELSVFLLRTRAD